MSDKKAGVEMSLFCWPWKFCVKTGEMDVVVIMACSVKVVNVVDVLVCQTVFL